MKATRGFTLVEILIVVVILGILAAIVIPQFTEASTEAKTSRLASDLQTMRSQIELYKVQHSDAAPAIADFQAAGGMITQGADGFGPYLQKVPTNPFAPAAVGNVVGTAAQDPATCGWQYDPATGAINASDADHSTL
jgi:general secretion pathway protein G